MADESSVAAGKRFANDMKRIREDRGLSVDDLHKETRIARSLIHSFEEGGLYDHSTFNEVYLRSFVRAYAEAIEIAPDVALSGLKTALADDYEDALARRYLQSDSAEAEEGESLPTGSESDASEAPPQAPVAGGPEGRGGLVGPPRALGEEGPSIGEEEEASTEEESPEASSADEKGTEGGEADAEEAAVPEKTEEEKEAEPPPSEYTPSSEVEEKPAASEDTADEEEEENESLDVRPDWMDEEPDSTDETVSSAPPEQSGGGAVPSGESTPVPPGEAGDTGIVGEPTAVGEESSGPAPAEPARTEASAGGRARQSTSGWTDLLGSAQQEMLWAGIGIAVVLLVLVGLGVAFFSSGETPAEDTTPTATVADTTSATSSPDSAASSLPPPADITLGVSIPLTIVATDNVRGIRIRRDEDIRRPYWIEEGDAQVFPFEQQVVLENGLGDVRLLLAGYPYPVQPQDTVGGLEITRDQAQAFVDTLRGAPTTLSVSPDTIPVGPPEE